MEVLSRRQLEVKMQMREETIDFLSKEVELYKVSNTVNPEVIKNRVQK